MLSVPGGGSLPQQRSSLARKYPVLLAGLTLVISILLVVYSQTVAFSLDEGFHLLASQLINAGRTPYLDFCFPQPPLNTYWNAWWMRVLGDTWHVPHVFAALFVAGAIALTAQFVFSRFPFDRWRFTAAVVATLMVATSVEVVTFGTVQAYGMCLFFVVASFRAMLAAVERESLVWCGLAGVLAGAAAAASLLSAPVAPVLMLWMLVQKRTTNRWARAAIFLTGALIPFLPVIWLFLKAPQQVFFNVVEYQLLYRRVNWTGASRHDFDVLTSWLNSAQAFLLGLFAIAGVLFLRANRRCNPRFAGEFLLSGWLAVALTAYISLTHPTFERYYLLAVPFFAIPASVGVYGVTSRLGWAERPFWPAVIVSVLFCLALTRRLVEDSNSYTWEDYEKIARKVEAVTPSGEPFWADEVIYFLTRRPPPPGMEFSYSHKLDLPAPEAASLHIVSERELSNRLKHGFFATVETCADDDKIEELGLRQLYAHHAEVSECDVFWGRPQSTSSPAK